MFPRQAQRQADPERRRIPEISLGRSGQLFERREPIHPQPDEGREAYESGGRHQDGRFQAGDHPRGTRCIMGTHAVVALVSDRDPDVARELDGSSHGSSPQPEDGRDARTEARTPLASKSVFGQ
jgi:hypothetical protein